MIFTKGQLKECLRMEKELYLPKRNEAEWVLTSDNRYKIFQYVRLLRFTEFHYNNRENLLHKFLYVFYRRRKNILGRKLGIEMWENTFESGIMIYHAGNIVINGDSKIGKDCKLHGSNCIGNNGKTLEAPIIGNNVRLGVGAKVIGNVTVGDNAIIAAGAVVIHDVPENTTVAGVPAKVITSI